jgi:hypothetical protein
MLMKLTVWIILFTVLLVFLLLVFGSKEGFGTASTGFYKVKLIGAKIPSSYTLTVYNTDVDTPTKYAYSSSLFSNNELSLGQGYKSPSVNGMSFPWILELKDSTNKIIGRRTIQTKSFKPILYGVTVNATPSSGPTLVYNLDAGGSGSAGGNVNYPSSYPKVYIFVSYWGSTVPYTQSDCNYIVDTVNQQCTNSLDKLSPVGSTPSYSIVSVSEIANSCQSSGPPWTNCQMDLQMLASSGSIQPWAGSDLCMYTFLLQSGVYTSIQNFMYNCSNSLIAADDISTVSDRPEVSMYICSNCNGSSTDCLNTCLKFEPDSFITGTCLGNYSGTSTTSNCPFEFQNGSFALVFETLNATSIHTVKVGRWLANLNDSTNYVFSSRITNVQSKITDEGTRLYFVNLQLLNSSGCPQTSLNNNDTISIYAIFTNDQGSTGITLTYNYITSSVSGLNETTSNTFSWNWCSTNPLSYKPSSNLNTF